MIRKLIYKTFTTLAGEEVRRFESASKDPKSAQLSRLSEIIQSGRNSAFGREHGFNSVRNYDDYCRALPPNDYEYFRPYVDRLVQGEKGILTSQAPFMFATTSGTTNKRKLIPITKDYISEFRRASKVSCYKLFQHFPALADGCALTIASPAEEGRTVSGIPFGAISGALYLMEPEPVRQSILSVPYDVFTLKDYETRYYCILRTALAQPVTSFYTLNPSTIFLLGSRLKMHGAALARDLFDGTLRAPDTVPRAILDKISSLINRDRTKGRLLDKLVESDQCVPWKVWPELAVSSCWTKAAASFYLPGLKELLGETPICDITYGASEGRGTIFLSPDKQALAIRSHFYEFIPVSEIESTNPTFKLAHQLELGESYYILLTTSAGLYRYNIRDVVKVVGFHNETPLIEFQYRGGNVFSFSGEKITELQVTDSIVRALSECSMGARFFTVIPQFDPTPHYSLWLELQNPDAPCPTSFLEKLANSFDRELSQMNHEYSDKRRSLRLDPPGIRVIKPGSYEALRKELVSKGTPDSQVKLSHLNPKEDTRVFFEDRLI